MFRSAPMQNDWKLIQNHLKLKADGIPREKTCAAIKKALGLVPQTKWPSQSEVRSGKSIFGVAAKQANLVTIDLPYPMKLSWEMTTTTQKLRCHHLVAESLKNIFQNTLDHYGLERLSELGLDVLGGCFNNRAIIGGKATSLHAWGIAIDIDPNHNGLNEHAPKARLSRADYDAFWKFVEQEGATSLGKERDYDWMHFQFASLN